VKKRLSFTPYASSPKSFCENVLHLSGRKTNNCHTINYVLKDIPGIFQRPSMTESGKKFSAKRFFNLSRTIFQSQPNVFPFSAERNEVKLKDA